MDTWIASMSWLLWIRLFWTWLCRYLLESLSQFFLVCPEVEWLNQMITLLWICCRIAAATLIYIPQKCTRAPVPSHPHQCLLFSVFNFFFFFSPCNGCKAISHYSFGLHCSNDYWFWTSFHMLVSHLFSPLERHPFKSFACFLIRLFGLFVVAVEL